ncbi:PKD domain-containing protein [Acidipila rosea]|uniref:PKD/Chitinase domain-containing protein n=1 Tax=Acidipila rosea TaxID=768535 RepID=A0A4V2PVQ2_9BACT|nr:PKD domain-containing protein [Acidipila rosea]TCK75311.1 hypothetical protein C7378_0294 [Acidipila rosea]
MPVWFLRATTARTRICLLFTLLTSLLSQAKTTALVTLYPIPQEVSSSHFLVSVNGRITPVLHAAANYYMLNFDTGGAATISVTASNTHYWDAGVEVQPMRLGIRPRRNGATITFDITGPVKLSITRPGDHFAESEMLFLFANAPDQSGITAQTPGVRYYAAGVHHGSINPQSGDTVYLAGGAVVFGALNLWQVHDVKVLGRGTIIYNGPQSPDRDEGWMHKRDWHVIVMDNADNIVIDGITGIVRSRTWMVQMRDSRHIVFRNVKIIGGGPGNANQDGMDWLGGGDTLVDDSFIRAADDIFAMYGNWDGYEEKALTMPGHEVSNIVIQNSVLSTSISNVVRVGWPKKVFDSHGFVMRNSDVMHMGFGACGAPFALFEVWADPEGRGEHSGYKFENIRLEDWYSLVQLRQPNPSVHDVTFQSIWAMDGPGMVPSVLKGDIYGVSLDGVDTGAGNALSDADLPLAVEAGAGQPTYKRAWLDASFDYSHGLLRPGKKIVFKARGPKDKRLHYHWLLGDGSTADGQKLHHVFPDTEGTLLDGSGRFRVLLHVWDDAGHNAWSSQSLVIASRLHPPVTPDISPATTPSNSGILDRYVRVPADGGYTFTLLTSMDATLAIDSIEPAHSPSARAQVCGSQGNAVQPIRMSAALSKGWHHIRIRRSGGQDNATNSRSNGPLLLWQGPRLRLQPIPDTAYFRSAP